MKRIHVPILLLSMVVGAVGSASEVDPGEPSPYERLVLLYKSPVTDQELTSFIASLSKKEFKELLTEQEQQVIAASTSRRGLFEFFDIIKAAYYTQGAGKQDGFSDWIHDVADRDYPTEWRSLLMRYRFPDPHSLTAAQIALCTKLLYDIVLSPEEAPGLRRQALIELPAVLQYDAISSQQLDDYTRCLKQIVTTPDQHTGLFQIALREIGRVIDYAKQVATKADKPAVAKAIQTGDAKALATDKALSEEQKQFFGQVTQLSADYDVILHDLGSSTNLPNYLLREVQRTQEQREADAENHVP